MLDGAYGCMGQVAARNKRPKNPEYRFGQERHVGQAAGCARLPVESGGRMGMPPRETGGRMGRAAGWTRASRGTGSRMRQAAGWAWPPR